MKIKPKLNFTLIGRYSKLADLDKVRACLREGADINWTNPDSKTQTHPGGETCLMRAVHGDWQNPRKYQVIEFLLSQPRGWRSTSRITPGPRPWSMPWTLTLRRPDLSWLTLELTPPSGPGPVSALEAGTEAGRLDNVPWILWTVFKFMARENFEMR